MVRYIVLLILGLATAALVFIETRQVPMDGNNELRIMNQESTTTPPMPAKTAPAKPRPPITPTIPISAPIIQIPIATPIVSAPPSPKATEGTAAEPIKFDEEPLKRAVVRIRCGSTFGSGFVMDSNGKKYVITAAHIVIDYLEAKNYNCDAIFPRKDDNGNYKETYYRVGKIILTEETEKNYKEKGIDLAVLQILPLDNPSEDLTIFPNGYPFVNYDLCPPGTRSDQIILLGYSANLGTAATPGAFQSRFAGTVVQYADVNGVIKEPDRGFASGYVYVPDFTDSTDQNVQHHLSVILSENNFSGASGGLVFNLDKKCVIGANIATIVQDNKIFGFITNPNFGPIKDFIERAIKQF